MDSVRILIVEDDAILATYLKDLLFQMGYQVSGLAATGEAAVSSALEHKPDAILMDIRLRGAMTGIQAAQAIQRQADIPVVYLTAHSDETFLQQAKTTGAYAYLTKPVRERELHASLEMALYKHTAEQRLERLNQILRAVREVDKLITREHDPQRLQEGACQTLLRTRGYRFAWIGLLDGNRLKPSAVAGEGMNLIELIRATATGEQGQRLPGTQAFRTRQVTACLDMLHDERYAPWRAEVAELNFQSTIAVPMLNDERLFGILNVYADQPNMFDDEEADLLLELAGDIAFGLKAIEESADRKRAETTVARLARHNELLLNSAGEGIYGMDSEGKITLVNPAAVTMLGWEAEELRGQFAHALLHHTRPDGTPYPQEDCPIYAAFRDGAVHHVEDEVFWRKDGTSFSVEYTSTPLRDENGALTGAVAVFHDITERKRAEVELAKLHRAVETSGEVIFLTDRDGVITYINPEFTNLYGYTAFEVVGRTTPRILKSGLLAPDRYEGLWKTILSGQSIRGEWINKAKSGRLIEIEGSSSPIQDEDGSIIGFLAIQRDMTERKRAEAEIKRRLAELEAVNQISTAMRAARTLAEMLPVVLDIILEVMGAAEGAIWLYDPAKEEVRPMVTRGWGEETGGPLPSPEKPGEGIAGYVFASRQPYIVREYHLDLRLPEALRQRIPPGVGGAAIPIRAADAVIGTFDINVPLPRELTPDEAHLLTILGEIVGNAIQRTRLHERTEQHLQRLGALHEIDAAINASLDVQFILKVFVDKVMAQLGVDATAVMLLDPHTQMLEYMAGRGFRAQVTERIRQRLGEGNTGRAALERRIIHIPNLREAGNRLRRTALLITDEGFVTYYGVPLIAKGQVMGVLEIFHRAPLSPDAEWLDFLEALAEQAAIAIDNVTLFDNLQRSNTELTLAYDATIEGWSRALDLRDKETEGHTRRVTEMTLTLARAMSFGEDELVQVRRGALLHDIGKMGVPDKILLKPGPLTDEEWMLMKKHPSFAYEMLSPIGYLRSALDIPYCHHEKWDGTGYPRGLKGEEIPLTARIFAMVDVWDALRSDRPYRQSWPEERVQEHLRSLSGTHFDPQVTEVFLKLLA